MLRFNELRITPDQKHLIVDVEVQPLEYYDDVYVGAVVIDTQKTFSETGPSSKALFTFEYDEQKHIREVIDIDTIANNLFFVYAIASGTPSENTPCGMTESSILGVAYDKYPMYIQGMKLLREMGGCEPSSNLIDYILQRKAFDISLLTGNYSEAIKYWNAFYNTKEVTVKSKCGCHGKII